MKIKGKFTKEFIEECKKAIREAIRVLNRRPAEESEEAIDYYLGLKEEEEKKIINFLIFEYNKI